MEDLQDMFIVHSTEEVQVGLLLAPSLFHGVYDMRDIGLKTLVTTSCFNLFHSAKVDQPITSRRVTGLDQTLYPRLNTAPFFIPEPHRSS